jgi:hypothetical protein
MSKAAAQIDRYETDKARLEAAPKRPTAEGRVETAPVNAVEKYLSGFSPRSQSWLRAHMDCLPPNLGGNRVKHAKMMLGHETASDSGIALESDDYFKAIEEALGLSNPVSAAAVLTPAVVDKPAKKALPSAPVNRDVPSATGARTTRSVTLNQAQREAAKMSFPHLSDKEAYGIYAKNLLELEAEGKLGRVTH